MFVQVVRAPVADEDGILRSIERWKRELRAAAEGFLGSTAGVTNEGQFVLVARFEDEQTARRNSDRPEQDAWWAETQKALAGQATFFESTDVDLSMGGGADDAGFVQILMGKGDHQRAKAILARGEEVLRRERPDIVGGITAWRDDGTFIDVAYFRSEAEARAGEAAELSAEGQALFEQLESVMPVQEYLDLPHPRFAS